MRRVALCFILGVPAVWANLLTNGSFEQPNLTGNTKSEVFAADSTDIPGWVVTGFGPSTVSILRSNFTDGDLTFLPHAGDQSLNLTGDFPGEAAGVLQNVKLKIGDQYELTFWIGNQDNSVTNYVLDSEAGLFLNGNLVDFYANGDNTHHALNWKEFTVDFTATQTNNSIQFENATLTFDHEIGLDSVDLEDVTPQAATTPEPGAFLLAAAGLSVFGVRRIFHETNSGRRRSLLAWTVSSRT